MTAIELFAGLGFIFIGTQFLTAHMKLVAGAGFHRMAARATGHPLKSMLTGIAAGAVIQSTNAVTFIVIGLVSAGAVTVRSAMPIVTWSYAGSTLRLLLVSLDIAPVIMLGIGALGIVFLMGGERNAKYRDLIAAMLGLLLLLYGVELMTHAAVPLRSSQRLRDILSWANEFYLWGFVAGAALAVVIQGQTVSVIALALVVAGVLDTDQGILIVVGANLGSGIQTIIQGAGLSGTARQLNVYQLVMKAIGVAVLLPLLMLEHYAGIPTVGALVRSLSADPALQLTGVHWMFQIVSATVATAFSTPLLALLERLSPQTTEEALSKPRFIQFNDGLAALAAVSMVEQEQLRLLQRLPSFLGQVCGDGVADAARTPPAVTGPAPGVLRKSGDELIAVIDNFLKSRLDLRNQPDDLDRLMRLWNTNQTLKALHEALAALAGGLQALQRTPAVSGFAATLAESAHALTSTVADEMTAFDDGSAALLMALTSDRSALMAGLRETLWQRAPDLSPAERQLAWDTADAFEQMVWLLNRYAVSLSPAATGT